MTTIRDVARHAGVSMTTVSHVVNGTRTVSAEGRRRVEQAIEALGYVPSAVARSLKRQSTRTVGMMIPNSSNPYFAELARSVEDRCFAAGYTLVLCSTDDDARRQSVYLQVLSERRIDGLIVVSTGRDAELRQMLAGLTMPFVLVDREIAEPDCDLVETGHLNGGLLATRHLLSLGHERIACIGGPPGLAPSDQRIDGWRLAFTELGRTQARDGMLWRGDFTSQGGYEAMHAIARSSVAATAVFVCNDLMAIGALRAAHECGARVPDDLSVVGFDDIELSAYTSPPLTTVAQPKGRIGALAVDMLIERISGERSQGRKVVLAPELRVRASTGRCWSATIAGAASASAASASATTGSATTGSASKGSAATGSAKSAAAQASRDTDR